MVVVPARPVDFAAVLVVAAVVVAAALVRVVLESLQQVRSLPAGVPPVTGPVAVAALLLMVAHPEKCQDCFPLRVDRSQLPARPVDWDFAGNWVLKAVVAAGAETVVARLREP